MGINKYNVGDWMYGDRANTFYRINRVGEIRRDGLPVYGVSYMLDKHTHEEFKHLTDLSGILEKDLHPVTDPLNMLLCLTSELRKKHRETLCKVDQLTRDIDAVSRARRLLLLCHAIGK